PAYHYPGHAPAWFSHFADRPHDAVSKGHAARAAGRKRITATTLAWAAPTAVGKKPRNASRHGSSSGQRGIDRWFAILPRHESSAQARSASDGTAPSLALRACDLLTCRGNTVPAWASLVCHKPFSGCVR